MIKILSVLIRIEALKAMKRPVFWVTVGIFCMFNLGYAVFFVYGAYRIPGLTYALPESWPAILMSLRSAGAYFIPVLTILLCAPEYSWRTGRQNVIDGLSKERYYAGKAVLLTGLIPLFLIIAMVIGLGGTLFSPSEGGPEFIRWVDLRYMGGVTLNLLLLGSLGLMLATLIRSAGAALGVLFVYLIVEEVLAGLMLFGSGITRAIAKYLPLNVAQGLRDDMAYYTTTLIPLNPDQAELGLNPLSNYPEVGALIIAALTYSGLFLYAAFLIMRHRDL